MPICVVSHKNTSFPESDLYWPIAVGPNKFDGAKYRDDLGKDNIAHLNRFYCELTATYWVWKNINADFVGICHYRRYFNFVPTTHFASGWLELAYDNNIASILADPRQAESIERILQTYDIIVPRSDPCPLTLRESYLATQSAKEWDVFVDEVDFLYGRHNHPLRVENRNIYGNMLICRKDVFDHYCKQLFFVIDRVFQRVGEYDEVPGARYQPFRYPGYLAERFTSAFIFANRLRAYESQIFVLNNV
ncbi:hypothetical protein BTH42_22870 [Burkholderia sp. SRS-W-2-2016]|uniref:DUF4422 domain-containing protein n=1 Tax=Burkholderia sp. SRS-W-2-2016 TaxID=1926878 RepID=UPI00094AF19B|nr:DUF4422 domain-containing protein [Burkholderia sp. SRS-W-2-2016]OLL29335.1 hypothetical protein BTH42_22870 [Burkholderia sp. SRS-W-2-2016]